MQRSVQLLEDIVSSLSSIEVEWKDRLSGEIESELVHLKALLHDGSTPSPQFIETLLRRNFEAYSTIFRLFMELSRDQYEGALRDCLAGAIGVKAFQERPEAYIQCLVGMGLQDSVVAHLSRRWSWDDVIVERLKLGRGSAIRGQQRGRFLELEVEKVIKEVFGDGYDKNCNFVGIHGQTAKAEFAIPDRNAPSILFEVKAYGATGSKQTDVTGDIGKIISAKKPFMEFLFVTDGITWKQRLSDLKKIVARQNDGDIRKIYTLSMMPELKSDLEMLKHEHNL